MTVVFKKPVAILNNAVEVTSEPIGEVMAPTAHDAFTKDFASLKTLEDATAQFHKEQERDVRTRVRFGGLLRMMLSLGTFSSPGEFHAYCYQHFQLKERAVQLYMQVSRCLEESGLPLAALNGASWSKVRLIVQKKTPEELVDWISTAQGSTVAELLTALNGTGVPEEPKTTVVLKLAPPQFEVYQAAITMAKHDSKGAIKSDSFAFEMICLQFLGKAPPALGHL